MASRLIDETGHRYGALLVLHRGADRGTKHRVTWVCRCDCGREYEVVGAHLRQGATTRCLHCAQSEAAHSRIAAHGPQRHRLRHGHGSLRAGTRTTTYVTWMNMVQRCTNPRNPAWKWYGARGIGVCDRWRDYTNFLTDMGERPANRSIDRIDVDGDYEPGNCRWATAAEQANNKRPRQKAAA